LATTDSTVPITPGGNNNNNGGGSNTGSGGGGGSTTVYIGIGIAVVALIVIGAGVLIFKRRQSTLAISIPAMEMHQMNNQPTSSESVA